MQILIIIVGAVVIGMVLLSKLLEETRVKKREQIYDKMIRKYKLEHGVSEKARVVKYYSGIKAMDKVILEQDISSVANEQDYFFWKNGESLNILSCPLEYSTLENYFFNFEWSVSLDISKISYYIIQGEKYATTNIQGGGSSLGKAIVGGVIAGGVGAVIASRENITSTTDFIDERRTVIYYQCGDKVSNIVLSSEAYDYLLENLPDKEYGYIMSLKENKESSDISNELEQLAQLRDKGIITDDEFNLKKKQILGL